MTPEMIVAFLTFGTAVLGLLGRVLQKLGESKVDFDTRFNRLEDRLERHLDLHMKGQA